MKHPRKPVIVVLLVAFMLSSCAQTVPTAVTEPLRSSTSAAVSEMPVVMTQTVSSDSGYTLAPLAAHMETSSPSVVQKEAESLFRAKFEGHDVAGSGEIVDGVYRFTATQTDGEAWHVKLESNYPTVSGRDYRVTYRFHSDVAGKVKLGDFQEFEIQKGENEVTGMVIATGGTSYLDLQLGMLPPFTIDFSEIEIEEYADEVDYEDALSVPVNFERESIVWEKHDQGYAPVLTRSSDAVSIDYLATSWDSGVWKSKLYAKTGLIPEAGVRYRITADVSCDQDMPFEVLFNNDEEEKGYGALYGQSVAAGEVKTCEAVIIGSGEGDDLVLQFSFGEAPEGSVVKVGNLHVEKIIDHYSNMLPTGFALDNSVETGKMLTTAIPVSYKNIPLTNFSYSGTDTVFEGHDDGYVVNLTETSSSASLAITQAPASDRGVWKVRLYAATGVTLEAGETYRIKFDLASTGNQAQYEVLYAGDSDEAYGADKARSLTAGGTDQVEYVVTPDASHGALTLILQLGLTDTTAGNTVTLSGLSVEKMTVQVVNSDSVSLSTGTAGNVWENHDDGFEQTVSVSGSSAVLNVTAVRSGADIWNSKLFVATGVTPEAGAKYRVSATVAATGETGNFEILYRRGDSADNYDGNWAPTGPGVWTSDFVAPSDAAEEIVLVFQLGNTAANNTITVSDLQVCKLSGGTETAVDLSGFAYPVSTASSTTNNSFDLEANSGAAAVLSGDGTSATATVTTPGDDWHVKLYAKPGLELEAGQSYTISMDVTGAAGCTACYKNTATGVEDGFGTEAIVDGTVTHAVAPTDSGTLEILLKIGNVAANTAVTVSNVTITKTATDYIPIALAGFGYPTVTHHDATNGSFSVESNGSAAAELSGNGTSASVKITASPQTDSWHVKFRLPDYSLAAGKVYKVSFQVTGANGATACYGIKEPSYDEELFGTEAIGSDNATVTHIVAPASDGKAMFMLKLGTLPVNTVVTVSSFKIEECAQLDMSGTDYNLEFNNPGVSAGAGTWDGGNSFTITATPDPQDNWPTKFFVRPHRTLTAGTPYLVSFNIVSGHDGFDVCYLNPDGWNEEAHGGHSWVVTNTPFSHVIVGEGAEMQLILKAGWAGVGTTTTVSNLRIADLSALTDVTPSTTYPSAAYDTLNANSFDLEANSGAAATLTGDGSSATATVTTPGDDWHIELYAKPGVELQAGKYYRITMSVTGAASCTACYKRVGGEETDFGTETIADGTVTHLVTPTVTGTLEILLKIGNVAANTAVTVSNIQVAEYTTGDVDVTPGGFAYPVTTPGGVTPNSFDLEANSGAAATLTGDGSSATATITTSGDDWHIKLYAKPGVELQAGQPYTITMNVTGADGCAICYKRVGGEETDYGTETAGSGTVTHSVTPTDSGTMEILLKLGTLPAGSNVTVSDIAITTLGGETVGDNLMSALSAGSSGNVGFWAHDDYSAALSGDGSSASLAVSTAPADGREAWKIKCFVDTGISLSAGKNYRVSADVSATAALDFELCCNDQPNGGGEQALGFKGGLSAASATQTVTCDLNPAADAALHLQFNLGLAASGTTFTISNVKVEEVALATEENALPSFSYDSVGSFSSAADDGYITALEKSASSATFRILQAPADRNPWNVKLNVRTGFTPEKNKGYRVSFDLNADKAQGTFELFLDGSSEGAYGQFYGPALTAGKNSISQFIYPGDSKGELVLQIRLGKTNGTDGNSYTISNLKLEEVTFRYTQTPETKEVTTLDKQNGYVEQLEKTRDRATVRIEKTPAEGKEPWKSKLFVETGVTLKAGQKYRISMVVKSIIPAPFEVCFNDGGVEKGLGAIFGLISTPTGRYVEYVAYVEHDTQLVIQLSLGNCSAPNSIMLESVKVEKAGRIDPISDTVYTFS